tara:strand:+ start:118 stop:279 length:162 start_codon:yes stop_codon:yes gene_type:complete
MELRLCQNVAVAVSQVFDIAIALGCPATPKFSFVRIVKRQWVDTVIVDVKRLT